MENIYPPKIDDYFTACEEAGIDPYTKKPYPQNNKDKVTKLMQALESLKIKWNKEEK